MVMAVNPATNGIQLSAASSVHTPAYSSFEPVALTHRPESTAVCDSYDAATDTLTVATTDQQGARVDIQAGDVVTIGAGSAAAAEALPGGLSANAKYLVRSTHGTNQFTLADLVFNETLHMAPAIDLTNSTASTASVLFTLTRLEEGTAGTGTTFAWEYPRSLTTAALVGADPDTNFITLGHVDDLHIGDRVLTGSGTDLSGVRGTCVWFAEFTSWLPTCSCCTFQCQRWALNVHEHVC